MKKILIRDQISNPLRSWSRRLEKYRAQKKTGDSGVARFLLVSTNPSLFAYVDGYIGIVIEATIVGSAPQHVTARLIKSRLDL